MVWLTDIPGQHCPLAVLRLGPIRRLSVLSPAFSRFPHKPPLSFGAKVGCRRLLWCPRLEFLHVLPHVLNRVVGTVSPKIKSKCARSCIQKDPKPSGMPCRKVDRRNTTNACIIPRSKTPIPQEGGKQISKLAVRKRPSGYPLMRTHRPRKEKKMKKRGKAVICRQVGNIRCEGDIKIATKHQDIVQGKEPKKRSHDGVQATFFAWLPSRSFFQDSHFLRPFICR